MITSEQISEAKGRVQSSPRAVYTEAKWPTLDASPGIVPTSFQPARFECLSESVLPVDPIFSNFEEDSTTDDAPSLSGGIEESPVVLDDSDSPAETPPSSEQEEGESFAQQLQGTAVVGVDHATHEAAVAQALEEGYARGCAEARAEIELYQQQLEERYTVLWEDMQTQLRETTDAHEQQAVELAFQIARRMVGAVVNSQKEYVVSVVKEALQVAGSSEIKTVRVSPQDFEFLQLGGYGERIKIHGDKKLVFESDESIRSGCIVVTNAGEVDFDLDRAWARMHEKALQGPRS
jgi:flagellar biosynthesis/type III secretory pathway protein FliH